MRLNIKRVSNGFILTDCDYEDGDGKKMPMNYCIEFDEKEADAVSAPRALHRLLWQIVELLGEGGSRYDRERISIEIRHGDKHECKDPNCDICANDPCTCWNKPCTQE